MDVRVSSLITSSLKLATILSELEDPTAAMQQDCLGILNNLLDRWKAESLSCHAYKDDTFTWPSGESTRTIGPTGDFVTQRPVQILESSYYVWQRLSYPLIPITQLQYDSIVLKDLQVPIPQWLYVNMTEPNLTMKLYPIPSQPIECHFMSPIGVAGPVSLSDILSGPPGYSSAYLYNLTVEICAFFGINPQPKVESMSVQTKKVIKRLNSATHNQIMSMPSAIVSKSAGNLILYTGWP